MAEGNPPVDVRIRLLFLGQFDIATDRDAASVLGPAVGSFHESRTAAGHDCEAGTNKPRSNFSGESIIRRRLPESCGTEHGNARCKEVKSAEAAHGQKRSVLGLVGGEFEAAALSDDKVKSMLKDGTIKESDYRVIYQSEVIPRLTIGYLYNLAPELAAKVTAAVLDFENIGGARDDSTAKPMRFFVIDYKKDFEFVRKIDDSFDPRFRKTPKTETSAAPADDLTKG